MPIYQSRSHARVIGILIIPLLFIVAACGVTATGSKADATRTATAIPPFVNCAITLPEMHGAQVVQILDTDFPDSGAALVSITSPASAPLQVVQYTSCMQVFAKGSVGNVSVPVVSNTSSPTAEVIEALNLANRGWTPTQSFPFDGTNIQPYTTGAALLRRLAAALP